MLTSAVETYADVGQISGPDINLKVMLRRNVVPAFLIDVGYCSWRRAIGSITTVAGTQAYDLPDDFGTMQVLGTDPANLTWHSRFPSQYIGDNPEAMLAAEATTTNASSTIPLGWYLIRRAAPGSLFKRIKFSAPFGSVVTIWFSYYTTIPFADDVTDVELSKYVPDQFQWALVEGLKKEIMFIRFGIADPRYTATDEAYVRWLGRIADSQEMAQRNKVAFVR